MIQILRRLFQVGAPQGTTWNAGRFPLSTRNDEYVPPKVLGAILQGYMGPFFHYNGIDQLQSWHDRCDFSLSWFEAAAKNVQGFRGILRFPRTIDGFEWDGGYEFCRSAAIVILFAARNADRKSLRHCAVHLGEGGVLHRPDQVEDVIR